MLTHRRRFGLDRPARHSAPSRRPTLDVLESRELLSVSSISSNFNGKPIAAGSSVWFSSVAQVTGVGKTPVTIRIIDATITSKQFSTPVPDAVVTFSPTAKSASTTFDDATNTWSTTIPTSRGSRDVFLAGASLWAGSGLPGGIKRVTWEANITTDTPGVKVHWKWAAAVYSSFSTDYSALDVKPIDGSKLNPFANGHKAGTPENFTTFVVAGATGGGGSNFTGSYSATKTIKRGHLNSLSGRVYVDANRNGMFDPDETGLISVQVTLTGIDERGRTVSISVLTDSNGEYEFNNLRSGTYELSETQPENYQYQDGPETIGTVFDSPRGVLQDNDKISAIVLTDGEDGIDYNFGELFAGS